MNYCITNNTSCEYANENGYCSISVCLKSIETVTTTLQKDNVSYGVSCIICGESVPLTLDEEVSLLCGNHTMSKVCDKCKQAILHVRNQLEQSYINRRDFK